MGWRVKVRKENLNGDEVMLQRSCMPFLAKLVVVPIVPLWILFCWDWWRDWKLINNSLYDVEQKLAKKAKEMKDLLDERKILLATLKQEKKEISDSKRFRQGISEPFYMEVKFMDWLFFRRYPDLNPPDPFWKKFIDKKFLDDKPKPTGIRERMGISEHPASAGVSAYTMDKPGAVVLGGDEFDHVIQYREENPKKQRNKGNNGNSQRHWKNRRKGESEEEYEDRMEAGPDNWVEDYAD